MLLACISQSPSKQRLCLRLSGFSQKTLRMASNKAYTVPATKKHTATLIFAHGLGDSGAGWMDLAKNWRARGVFDHVKFVFPNAPMIPITVNFGMSMPGWYDITTFEDLKEKSHDEPGITKSRNYFNDMIQQEVDAGIPSDRVVLGGFSQGGAMSLFTGITTHHRLAGFFGLSSYLLLGHKLKELMPPNAPNKGVPVFMGHGEADPLVKYAWGKRTAEELENYGYKVTLKSYPGLVHSASMEEMDDLEKYLVQRLPETATAAAPQSKA